MFEVAVVGGGKCVVEDDTIGNCAECAKFVQRARNVGIGGCPSVTTATSIAGLGNPHLSTGNVLISASGVLLCAKCRNAQVLFAKDCLVWPMTAHCCATLGNAVVVVVTEHVHFGIVVAKKFLSCYNLETCCQATACTIVACAEHVDIANCARANKQAIGVVFA